MAGEINFSALQTPDFVGNALEAYQSGQKQRVASDRRNALALYGSGDRQGGINALMAVDPEAAITLEDRQYTLQKRQRDESDRTARIGAAQAYARGDTKGARQAYADLGDMGAITDLDEATRTAAKKATEEVAGLASWLEEQPYEVAVQTLKDPQIQSWLGERGFPPEKTAGFDPTPANLKRIQQEALTFTQRLDQKNKDRDFDLRSKKQAWDMKHGDRTAATAERNADSRRITATRPRAGGAGLPPPPSGWARAGG